MNNSLGIISDLATILSLIVSIFSLFYIKHISNKIDQKGDGNISNSSLSKVVSGKDNKVNDSFN